MTISAKQVFIVLAAIIGAVFLVFSQAEAWGQSQESPPQDLAVESEGGQAYVAERLIVTYEAEASEATEEEVVQESGGEVEESLEDLNAEVVSFPEVKSQQPGETRKQALRRAKKALEESPGVESVDYDYLLKPLFNTNDKMFSKQWGLIKPNFPEAWDEVTGKDGKGEGVKIAVVDTGISDTHKDLKRKILNQRDFVGSDADDKADDDLVAGHGTHVAGIAAASTDNEIGIAGGCPDCELLIAKVLTHKGGTTSDVAEGITWSADEGAKVINLSLGGPDSGVLEQAVDYAYGKGAVIVAAAGNEAQKGNTISYPAVYSNVIAVAATGSSDKRAAFSNYGSYVDVAAPGVDILSTVPKGVPKALPGGYKAYQGTSMASPHVAALAGLLAAQGRTQAQIRFGIVSTAVDLGDKGKDPNYGSGRIDAAKAVQSNSDPNNGWHK